MQITRLTGCASMCVFLHVYLVCYQSFDCVGVKVGACCLQEQSLDSSNEAGLLVKGGGPPHSGALWQSSSATGLSPVLAPEGLA